MSVRTVRIEAFSRVEGEGGLHLTIREGHIDEVRLEIFEPPRLFEAFLRGRKAEEVPDIVARICGICPVAYQMSSVHALEAALGIRISPEVRQLRRLLYCGEWIESHALHLHLLNAPDFLGFESGLKMAEFHRAEVERGLRLKKHGNQLLEALGGRAIHPINVALGGFHRLPRREQLAALVPDFEWGVQAACDVVRWVAGFDFPDFDGHYEFVSLVHPDEYPFNEGAIADSEALTTAEQWTERYEEYQVPHSTALHARQLGRERPYLVGPLARLHYNRAKLLPTARRLADEIGLEYPCRNPFKAIVARGLELVQAYEEALAILRDYRALGPARAIATGGPGVGSAATEAPRGLLWHRYEVEPDGTLRRATIVPPTSQNQPQIELDLKSYLTPLTSSDDATLAGRAENLVRTYDPCISCSTHQMRVTIDRV